MAGIKFHGFVASLPANLKSSETFAVLDQVRTVDYTRFKQIDEKGKPIFPSIPNDLYLDVWVRILNETLFNILRRDLPERYGPWQTVYERFTVWSNAKELVCHAAEKNTKIHAVVDGLGNPANLLLLKAMFLTVKKLSLSLKKLVKK